MKKKKVAREPWRPRWMPHAQLLGYTVYKELKLGLSILEDKGEYSLLVIETSGTSVETVFDDHAHKILGTYSSAEKAMAVATKYAKKWWLAVAKKRAMRGKRCGCEEISKEP